MLHKEVKNLENRTIFGEEWCAKYHKISNPFWKAVFSYWADFCASQQIISVGAQLRILSWVAHLKMG